MMIPHQFSHAMLKVEASSCVSPSTSTEERNSPSVLLQSVMDELSAFAEKLMNERGVENYSIHIEGLVNKGDNYLGEVLFFNITPKNCEDPLHFIRKRAKYVQNTEEQTTIKKAYQRESYMYKKIFPAMKDFQKRKTPNTTPNITPKVYYIQEEEKQEMLIFENMKYSGFQLLDKKSPMDHKRVSLVVETYAKFHSMSFAMSALEPENFRSLTDDMDNVWVNFKGVVDAHTYFGALFRDVLGVLEDKGRSDLVLKYKPIGDDIENVVYVEVEEADRLVISHGDSWNNNMLFKDDERGSPQSVCLIDFQLSSLSTPVIDLCQFLLSVGDKEVLFNIEEYLKIYHECLSDSLGVFGVDVDKVFSYEKLMEHWGKYGKTGLILAVSTIQVSLAEVEEIPDDLNSLTHQDLSGMKNVDKFNERMSDLLISFGEKFL